MLPIKSAYKMQTQEALKGRHSVRTFNSKPVSKDLLEKLIDFARLAPTAKNEQPWEFVVVTDKAILKQLGELTDYGKFIAQSSCCIAVFCSDTKYYLEDGCAATENILIAATDLGLAGCWVAGDKKSYSEKIKELLKAPAGLKLVSLIPLGYSDAGVQVQPPSKRPVSEVLHWEKF